MAIGGSRITYGEIITAYNIIVRKFEGRENSEDLTLDGSAAGA
jgi:hypothetical protein